MKRQTFWALKGRSGSLIRDSSDQTFLFFRTRKEAQNYTEVMSYAASPVKVYLTIQEAP